jgi:pyruvate formate lyase activating enzyme
MKRHYAYCVCFFGGSPEPQLPFAIRASEMLIDIEKGDKKEKPRICWEWNGCGSTNLVKKAAEISYKSGGIVKFDLKAFNPHLSIALSGVPNKKAYENFEMIAEEFVAAPTPVLTATTLLVPYYVDEREVEGIASFIAGINPDLPYSLLVFHPDFYMRDMPITPREQVQRCYDAAKKHLRRVNIGNKHLIGLV